jgi:hypothetical protein
MNQTTIDLGEDDTLVQIQALAADLRNKELEVECHENRAAAAKEEARDIAERKLPDLMLSVGMSEFKLLDDSKVTLKKFYKGALKDREACFTWLRESGNDGVIKNTIKTEFGKGEEEEAKELECLLKDTGFTYQRKADIHHATLNSLLKELKESEIEFPEEAFGLYEGNKVTIKQ